VVDDGRERDPEERAVVRVDDREALRVAATSPEEHDNAIRFDYPMFSEVMTSEAFAEQLEGAKVAG
jgi:hypothetical protein